MGVKDWFDTISKKLRGQPTGEYQPTYQGQALPSWREIIADLKRDGELDEALEIARGCMDAMVQAALTDHRNIREEYVIEVAIIQRKQAVYAGEVKTVEDWLALHIPAKNRVHRKELIKRLARAKELAARAEGKDGSHFTQEWRRQIEAEKKKKGDLPVYLPTDRYTPEAIAQGWSAPGEALAYPMFVAVDFAIANTLGGVSACQIGLVKVDHGQIVDRLVTLIKPPPGYNFFELTHLHGLTKKLVKSAPSWPAIAADIARFVGDLPAYGHPGEFNSRVWRALDAHFHTQTAPPVVFCSKEAAIQILPDLPNHELETIGKKIVPNFKLDPYRADSDVEACALVVAALQTFI